MMSDGAQAAGTAAAVSPRDVQHPPRKPSAIVRQGKGAEATQVRSYIGRRVRQKFVGCGVHWGTVVDRAGEGWRTGKASDWKVQYDDDDEGTLTELQLQKWLVVENAVGKPPQEEEEQQQQEQRDGLAAESKGGPRVGRPPITYDPAQIAALPQFSCAGSGRAPAAVEQPSAPILSETS